MAFTLPLAFKGAPLPAATLQATPSQCSGSISKRRRPSLSSSIRSALRRRTVMKFAASASAFRSSERFQRMSAIRWQNEDGYLPAATASPTPKH